MESDGTAQIANVLTLATTFFSSGLVSDGQGGLVVHQACQTTSEQVIRTIIAATSHDNRDDNNDDGDNKEEEETFCSVPCFRLQARKQHDKVTTKDMLAAEAAACLAERIHATKDKLTSLPSTLVRNLVESFMSLVDSRVRSFLLALSHQLGGDTNHRLEHFLSILSALPSQSLVKPSMIVSTYRVKNGAAADVTTTTSGNQIAIPICQETIIDLDILGQIFSVVVSANGQICGTFSTDRSSGHDDRDDKNDTSSTCRLSSIPPNFALDVDTAELLRSMMETAREATKRATAIMSQVYLSSLASVPAVDSSTQSDSINNTNTTSTTSATATMDADPAWKQTDDTNQQRAIAPTAVLDENTKPGDTLESRHRTAPIYDRDGENTRTNDNGTMAATTTAATAKIPTTKQGLFGRHGGLDLLTRAAMCLNFESENGTLPAV